MQKLGHVSSAMYFHLYHHVRITGRGTVSVVRFPLEWGPSPAPPSGQIMYQMQLSETDESVLIQWNVDSITYHDTIVALPSSADAPVTIFEGGRFTGSAVYVFYESEQTCEVIEWTFVDH